MHTKKFDRILFNVIIIIIIIIIFVVVAALVVLLYVVQHVVLLKIKPTTHNCLYSEKKITIYVNYPETSG
jgi:hypothetical protein